MRRRSRSSSSGKIRRSSQLLAAAIGVVLASFGGSLSGTPAYARAPARSEVVALAEQRAAEAFEAYQRHDYGRAVQLYQQAMAAAPSADIAYNIARVYDLGLRDRPHAIEWYERYAADPGATPPRMAKARARLDELRAAERDDVQAGGLPAELERSGRDAPGAAAAPLEPHVDITRDFPLDGIEPGPQHPRSSRQADGFAPLQTAALTLGSMGLVGVGVGVGFGLAARARSDEWRRDCDGNACTSRRGVEAAESAERSATIATVGFAAGGGLLALGAALWLIDAGRERPERARALQVAPFLQAQGGGTCVSGSF